MRSEASKNSELKGTRKTRSNTSHNMDGETSKSRDFKICSHFNTRLSIESELNGGLNNELYR